MFLHNPLVSGSRLSLNGNRMASLIDNLPNGHELLTALDLLADDATTISGIENATGEAYAMGMHGATKMQQVFSDAILMRKTGMMSRETTRSPGCDA